MKRIFLLAGLLIFALATRAQVREEMAPATSPALVSPAPGYCPPESPYLDETWANSPALVAIETPSIHTIPPVEGPAVVEGSNDGPYIPTTFLPYQRALHEGMQELAAIQAQQRGQLTRSTMNNRPASPLVSRPPTAPSQSGCPAVAATQQRASTPTPSVAEEARLNRVEGAKAEQAKNVAEQDNHRRIVVIEEAQKPLQDSR
jgi:hypothetical protein